MGEKEDEQTLKLNETMDEFSSTVNICLSQLTLEMQKVEQSTGASVTQLRMAMEKKTSLLLPEDEGQRLEAEMGCLEAKYALAIEEKQMLFQQATVSHQALQQIRSETHLFRDNMLVDARTLCEYHVLLKMTFIALPASLILPVVKHV
eukprot:5801411-Amphidinium_carterae.1